MTALPAVQATPVALLADLEASGALTPVELSLPSDITFDSYEALGRMLNRMESATKWWIGDWLALGEARFGEAAYQAAAVLDLAEDTLQRYVLVASKVPPARRLAELTWTHHRHVAALEPADQTEWLERAANERWSARDLFEQLRGEREDGAPRGAEAIAAAARAVVGTAEFDAPRSLYLVPADAFDALARAIGADR